MTENSKATETTAAKSNVLNKNINTNTQPSQVSRIEEAKKIFDLLYSSVKESKYSYLWTWPDKTTYSFDISNADNRAEMAQQAIKLNDSGKNVYFGVCPTNNPLKTNERAKVGTERQPTIQTAVWADIDIEGANHKTSAKEKLAPDFTTAKSLLPFKASIIVHSGGGLHGYNLLSEPLRLNANNIEEAKLRNERYIDAIRHNAAEYKIDGVSDLVRILRVPGTYNYKNGRVNAPLCHIVEINDVKYSLEEFDKLIIPSEQIFNNKNKHSSFNYVDDPEYEEARIKRALDFVFPPQNYNDWLNILMALHSAGMSADVAEEWSSRDPSNYKQGEATEKFNSFNGNGAITVATLFDAAKQNGYDEKSFRYEWNNTHKTGQSKLSNNNEKVIDDPIIALFKSEKYKEAHSLALEVISKFLELPEVNIQDIYKENLLYAAGLYQKDALIDISYQSIIKQFREKCKKVTKLTGNDGLDAIVNNYANKFQAIIEERERIRIEKQQNEIIQKLRQQSHLATKAKCPLPFDKIILPKDYRLDFIKNKIVSVCGETNEVVFNSIMLISKIFKNAVTGIERIEIAILKPKDKHFRFFTTERLNIADKNKVIALSSFGVDVSSLNSKEVLEYFKEFELLNIDIIPNITTFNQTGWNGTEEFIYPTPHLDHEVEYDDVTKSVIQTRYSSAGDKEPVINLLKKVKSYDFANIAIGTVLAGSLVYHLKPCRNIAVHLGGKTESGKTAINLLAFSLIGNPNDKVPTFDSTSVGFEEIFASSRDICAIIEDLNSASNEKQRKQAENMPYQFVKGVGRTRSKAKGGLRTILEFRGSLLTNGERLMTSNTSNAGAKTRVIELCSDESKILPDKLSREIYGIIAENYGLFFKDWIECIISNKTDIKTSFRNLVSSWQDKFEAKSFTHIDSIAAITTANIFFDVNLLSMSEDEAINYETKCAERIIELLPDRVEIAEHERAKTHIRDWILSNPKKFIQQDELSDDTTTQGAAEAYETFGVIRKSFIAVYTSRLKSMLTDEGFSAEMVIKQLANDGFFKRDGKHLETRVRVGGERIPMTVIIKNKLYESESSEEE